MQDFEIQRYKINQIRIKYLLNYYQASMFLWRLENESIKRLGLIEAKRKKKSFLNGLFVKLFRKNVSFKESHEHHDQLGPRE